MSTKAKSTTRKSNKATSRPRRVFTAMQKCQAVLTIWTERQSMSRLAKELDVSWSMLNTWMEQAMDGMLTALEPKQQAPQPTAPLSRKLQKMLEDKGLLKETTELLAPSLQKRLVHVQEKQNQQAS